MSHAPDSDDDDDSDGDVADDGRADSADSADGANGPLMPTIRAVLLDARAEPASFPPLVAGAEATCTVRVLNPTRALTPRARRGLAGGTRDAVEEARGVDVIVVMAGPAIAAVARDVRLCVAAGARAGVVVTDATSTTTDEDERGVRHLFTGAGLVGDDCASVDSASPTLLHDVVARAAPPAPASGFIACARPGTSQSSASLHGRVVDGDMPSRALSHVLLGDAFVQRLVERTPGNGTTWFSIGDHTFSYGDEVVIASEPLPASRHFVVGDAFASIEPCVAFGGNGGFGNGKIGHGVLEVDRPICPKNGKLGVVLLKGAGLGPVRVVQARMLSSRLSAATDYDALWKLHRAAMKDVVERQFGAWNDDEQRARYATRSKPGAAEVFVDDDARIYAELIVEDRAHELYVSVIQVDPSDQSRGVGATIMRRVMAKAQAASKDVALRVLRANTRALTFYERLGFHVDDAASNDTHIAMRASLAPAASASAQRSAS